VLDEGVEVHFESEGKEEMNFMLMHFKAEDEPPEMEFLLDVVGVELAEVEL
jgi:hypothetical protein